MGWGLAGAFGQAGHGRGDGAVRIDAGRLLPVARRCDENSRCQTPNPVSYLPFVCGEPTCLQSLSFYRAIVHGPQLSPFAPRKQHFFRRSERRLSTPAVMKGDGGGGRNGAGEMNRLFPTTSSVPLFRHCQNIGRGPGKASCFEARHGGSAAAEKVPRRSAAPVHARHGRLRLLAFFRLSIASLASVSTWKSNMPASTKSAPPR